MRDRGSMLVFVMLVGVALTAAVTLALLPVLVGADRPRPRPERGRRGRARRA